MARFIEKSKPVWTDCLHKYEYHYDTLDQKIIFYLKQICVHDAYVAASLLTGCNFC